MRRIGAATTTTAHDASGTTVAVLDTGVDLANPDLDAVTGINCVKPGAPAQDDNGHGTHVAGIVAARNVGSGVVGVAPGTRIYAVKVLGPRATGTLSQFLCGINWVKANAPALNIRVANMSITGSGSNDGNCGNTNADSEHKAICAAVAAGVTFVVSAGNAGTDFARSIPAAYPEVLTVTAMTDTDGNPGAVGPAVTCKKGEADDRAATYSNYAVGPAAAAHTIAAPGTCVVSTKVGGGTATYYGTSQAAPHVTGAAALCIAEFRPARPLRRPVAGGRHRACARGRIGCGNTGQRLPRGCAAPARRQDFRPARHGGRLLSAVVAPMPAMSPAQPISGSPRASSSSRSASCIRPVTSV